MFCADIPEISSPPKREARSRKRRHWYPGTEDQPVAQQSDSIIYTSRLKSHHNATKEERNTARTPTNTYRVSKAVGAHNVGSYTPYYRCFWHVFRHAESGLLQLHAHVQPELATACKVSLSTLPKKKSRSCALLLNTAVFRFHNAQTVGLACSLSMATLYYAWRTAQSPQLQREFMKTAAFLGSIYWVAGLLSIIPEGTSGVDPEFGGPGFPQLYVFTPFLLCGLIGAWLEY